MDNVIKLASFYLNKKSSNNDLVKTAGVLTMLKNKVWSYFDKDKAEEIDKLLDETVGVKELLRTTYQQIKKVETAIGNLDLQDYNVQLDVLKNQVKELSNKLDTTIAKPNDVDGEKKEEKDQPIVAVVDKEQEKKEEEEAVPPAVEEKKEKEEEAPKLTGLKLVEKEDKEIDEALETFEAAKSKKNNKRPRDKELPPGTEIYLNAIGKTLADLGVGINNIKINSEGVKPIYASMALCEVIKNGEKDTDLLLKNQQLMDDEKIKSEFYTKIPSMEITEVKPRELDKDGKKKPGLCEVSVVGSFIPLPAPFAHYKLKPKFILVDTRSKADDKPKFTIYRQLIIAVRNDALSDSYAFNPTSNKVKTIVNLPGYNVMPKIESTEMPINDNSLAENDNSLPTNEANQMQLYNIVRKSINKKTIELLKNNSNKINNGFDNKIAMAQRELYKTANETIIAQTNKIAKILEAKKQTDLSEYLLFALRQTTNEK